MAIIKCPECEGNVSTQASKCVHCGCDLSICKECGSAFVGKLDVCPECGCKFDIAENVSKKKDESEKKEKAKSNSDKFAEFQKIYNQWDSERGKKTYEMIHTVISVLWWCALVGAAVLIAGAHTWGFEFNDKFTLVTVLIVAAGVIGFGNYVFKRWQSMLYIDKLSRWAVGHKHDLDYLIVSFMQNIKDGNKHFDIFEAEYYKNAVGEVVRAKAFKEDITLKSRIRNLYFVDFVIRALSVGMLWTFVIINAKNIAMGIFLLGDLKVFFTEHMSIEIIEAWWAIIVSVVLFVANIFYKTWAEGKGEQYVYNWFNQNYREYSEFYRKYVDKTVEQIDDLGSDV